MLVNNAGFGTAGRFDQLDLERELEMVRLNVEAVVDLCGRYVPELVRRGRGAVLNVASTAAFQPLPRQATYAASKAFVLAFTDALHEDLADTGVTATTLSAGAGKTEFMTTAGIDWEGLPGSSGATGRHRGGGREGAREGQSPRRARCAQPGGRVRRPARPARPATQGGRQGYPVR